MSTQQRIVTAMAESLRVQGYAATGISQIAGAAGAPVGSVYHHFRDGKSGIAAAALRASGAAYIQLLPLLLDTHDDLPDAIERAFETAAEDLETTGWANMCPVGTVAGEVVDAVPSLRPVVAEVFTSWVDIGTVYFETRGLSTTDARGLIYAVLGALEGAFILARSQRSREPLHAAGQAVAAYARSLSVAAPAPSHPSSARW